MKARLLILFFAFFFLGTTAQAQEVKLTPNAEISLLTCGPGNDLYSVFGHSAIRVKDKSAGLDAVFNYGTFTFSDDFYVKFTMGKLNYKLSVSSYDGFIRSYIFENRTVIEQELELTFEEKKKLFSYLWENYQPENRYYLYDFFYNNCSTKIRDALKDIFEDRITYRQYTKEGDPTFRQMLDQYLGHMDWSDFGIDIALGLPCDKTPNYWNYMFLPDELMIGFDKATLSDGEATYPLVRETRMLYEASPHFPRFPIYFRPIFLTLLFFFIVLGVSIWEWRKKKDFVLFDKSLFVMIGVFGLFLSFLWFLTDHTATQNNLNLLWANPLLVILGFFSFSKRQNNVAFYGFFAYSLIAIGVIIGWFALPQMLHYAVFPLVMVLALRSSLFVLKANNR